MTKSVKIYWTRLFLGFLLLPFLWGVGQGIFCCFRTIWTSCLFFLAGIFCYTMIYPVIKKPFRSYVWGHELSHVLGIWLCRGKVRGLKISSRGGQVRSDKSNLLIRLLPYFFPIYTFSILGFYLLISIMWDLSRYYNLLVFILGISWGFHLWMTIHVLWQDQPDIRYTGVVFSLVVIIILNIFILGILLAFVSPDLSSKDFLISCGQRIQINYIWFYQKLVLFKTKVYQYAISLNNYELKK